MNTSRKRSIAEAIARTTKRAKTDTAAKTKVKEKSKEEEEGKLMCHVAGCKETNDRCIRTTADGTMWCDYHLEQPRCSKDGCRELDPKQLEKVREAYVDPDGNESGDESEEYRCRKHLRSTSSEEEEDEHAEIVYDSDDETTWASGNDDDSDTATDANSGDRSEDDDEKQS